MLTCGLWFRLSEAQAGEAGMSGRQPGFRDVEHRLRELLGRGDPLEVLAGTVDFERFRPLLTKGLGYSDGAKGGRPSPLC